MMTPKKQQANARTELMQRILDNFPDELIFCCVFQPIVDGISG